MKPRSFKRKDGALVLSPQICCDGFAVNQSLRIQTHIHSDHMVDFCTSKANQHIAVTTETLALLEAIYNADIPLRSNIRSYAYKEFHEWKNEKFQLLESNHMLGSSQVLVIHSDGYRVGYSSDFFWPLEQVIKCDELVIDSTYGDSLRSRRFTQEQATECFIEKISESRAQGKKTACIAHNGRLQTALSIASEESSWPIITSPKAFALINVYKNHGVHLPETIISTSTLAKEIICGDEPFFAFATLPEQRHIPWISRMRKIVLSAYVSNIEHPLTTYSNGDCVVSFTDHADFHGTIEYIKQTDAKIVLADPRSGNAHALANSVTSILGKYAQVIYTDSSASWG